jgi:ribosomal protein S18 acetylase RimI-like enzyme
MKESYDLVFIRLKDIDDADIPDLLCMSKTPEISRYVSINEETFFAYVISSPDIYFYKVYKNDKLVGALHLEIEDEALFLSIEVHPAYHRQGIGEGILEAVQKGRLQPDFEQIKVSIDVSNIPSRRLFEKMGFIEISQEDELIDYLYCVRG